MEHFFYKLIPPRPQFHLDQNETEKAVMEAHAQYWIDLVAARKAITFGPVFHPEGVFGIAIIEAANEAEAKSIANSDPAVTSGIGNYELSPMIVALIRS